MRLRFHKEHQVPDLYTNCEKVHKLFTHVTTENLFLQFKDLAIFGLLEHCHLNLSPLQTSLKTHNNEKRDGSLWESRYKNNEVEDETLVKC